MGRDSVVGGKPHAHIAALPRGVYRRLGESSGAAMRWVWRTFVVLIVLGFLWRAF